MIKRLFFYFAYFAIFMICLGNCQCNSYTLLPKSVNVTTRLHFDLYLDADFDSHEVDLIEQATTEWETKTKNRVIFNIYYNFDLNNDNKIRDKRHSIVFVKLAQDTQKVAELDKWINEKQDTHSKIIGLYTTQYNAPSILLVYDRMRGDAYYRSCVEHELGHAMGLIHLKKENTLMFPSMREASRHITDDDLIEFCALYHCKIEDLK